MTRRADVPSLMPDMGSARDAIDGQVADMRRMLSLMLAPSAADALRALRTAFTDRPAAARTAAICRLRSQAAAGATRPGSALRSAVRAGAALLSRRHGANRARPAS